MNFNEIKARASKFSADFAETVTDPYVLWRIETAVLSAYIQGRNDVLIRQTGPQSDSQPPLPVTSAP